MVVPTGETERPSAVGTLEGPGDVLRFTSTHGSPNGWISAVWTIGAEHRLWRRNGRKDRSHTGHVGDETHVEVPFIVGREGFDPCRDGMLGQVGELGGPVG